LESWHALTALRRDLQCRKPNDFSCSSYYWSFFDKEVFMRPLVQSWMRHFEMAICLFVFSSAAAQSVRAADKEDIGRVTPVVQGGRVVAMQRVRTADPEEPTIALENVPVPEKHPLREVLAPILSHTNPRVTLQWRLCALDGGGSDLSDDDMGYVALLPDLEILILNRTKITDTGLIHVLRQLTRLRDVDLSETHVTVKAIGYLKNQKNLRKLTLDGISITDEGLQQLATLRSLRMLKLRGTDITDAGLGVLRDFPDLTDLILTRTSVGNEGLQYVGKLGKLESLVLDETRITDDGIAALKGLKNLESLWLGGTAVSSLQPLRGLPKLSFLFLTGTRVADACLPALESFPQLASVHLRNTRITDEGM
jgi:hypothetical protein